jgi:cell wall-associated NlpC family hydrolase
LFPLPLLLGAAAAAAYLYKSGKRPANSLDSDALPPSQYGEGVAPECQELVQSCLGWPYYYGKGGPSTPWEKGPEGVDCSGLVQMCLVKYGLLSPTSVDRGATDLANVADPVPVGSQKPGDFAVYPGHVTFVVGYPDPNEGGHSAVISASGGTSTTKGNDPNACVKLWDTADYRKTSAFITYARIKPGV